MPSELDRPTERRLQRWMLEQRYRDLREDRSAHAAAEEPAVGDSAAPPGPPSA